MNLRRAVISLCLLALTSCSGLSLGSTNGGAPVIQIAQSPADTVRAFLDAWNHLDYNAMYAQLSSQSQGFYTLSVFQALYQDADKTLGTKGVTYNIRDTHEQGDTTAVTYDATIQSTVFASIEDDGRVMRVVRAPDNTWRVAWSTMDIINGYANGTRLTVDSKRPPRGNIYDRNGQLMVEQDGQVVELYLAKDTIPDEGRCLDLLSVILRKTRADLQTQFAPFNAETVFYVGDVDPDIFSARQNDLVNDCAVTTNTRTTRRYVGHGIATHLIGYVGNISSEDLQSYLDQGLRRGRSGRAGGRREAVRKRAGGQIGARAARGRAGRHDRARAGGDGGRAVARPDPDARPEFAVGDGAGALRRLQRSIGQLGVAAALARRRRGRDRRAYRRDPGARQLSHLRPRHLQRRHPYLERRAVHRHAARRFAQPVQRPGGTGAVLARLDLQDRHAGSRRRRRRLQAKRHFRLRDGMARAGVTATASRCATTGATRNRATNISRPGWSPCRRR